MSEEVRTSPKSEEGNAGGSGADRSVRAQKSQTKCAKQRRAADSFSLACVSRFVSHGIPVLLLTMRLSLRPFFLMSRKGS